jgi:hypothetical protein
MKKLKSEYREIGNVSFPEFTGERVYMRPFKKKGGLPSDLKRWQPTVEAMLKDINTNEEIYIMIDQGVVKAGSTHRRCGPHIDGHWCSDIVSHGGSYPRHTSYPEKPSKPEKDIPPVHRGTGKHGLIKVENTPGFWNVKNFGDEALILASNISACYGYIGEIEGNPKDDGDCSHLDLSEMKKVKLKPNTVYSGNVTFIHESIPVDLDCNRTLVRLNVPGIRI